LKDRKITFSIVFTIEENTQIKNRTGRLYDELTAINTLELLNTIEDMEAEA